MNWRYNRDKNPKMLKYCGTALAHGIRFDNSMQYIFFLKKMMTVFFYQIFRFDFDQSFLLIDF